MKISTPSDREIVVSRYFALPVKLVFDGQTKPKFVKSWFTQAGRPMTRCKINLKVGGRFDYTWRGIDGGEMRVAGIFDHIDVPNKIVHQEVHNPNWTGGETTSTTTYQDHEGGTLLTFTTVYESKVIRNRVLLSPIAQDLAEFYDKMETFLTGVKETG